jgi:hypothetical protein
MKWVKILNVIIIFMWLLLLSSLYRIVPFVWDFLLNRFSQTNIITNTWTNQISYVENIVEDFVWNSDYSTIDNIKNAINSWKIWRDYISTVPFKQPNTINNEASLNNKVMWLYLSKYKSEFTIPKNKKNWYILFKTQKLITDNRQVFLWLWWESMWLIHKDKAIKVDETTYAFDAKQIPVSDFKWWINLFNHTIDWKIQIWWYVSETDNYVKEIIIVFY